MEKSETMTNQKYFQEESNFLDEVTSILTSVSSNLHGLFSDLTTSQTFVCLDSDLELLQRETQSLSKNIEELITKDFHGAQKAMSALQSELLELRQKYEHLQHERDSQQEHLGRMQAELFAVRNQIQRQSQFCASLGAVMGNLIWKASRLPVVIDMFLSGNKVGDLLNIVNGSLISFLETYESCIPGQCTDESQFIMSVCGIVTNIAAAPAGRQFLISSSNGKELLEQFCRVLAHIPLPSGNALKRLLLMALYNTSINENGLRFLQQQQYLLSAITQDLQINTTSELKLMSLRLLQSLTYDIPNKSVLNGILKEVSLEMLQPMTQSSEAELKNVVGDIIDNINKALKKYGKNASQGDNQIRAKCPGSCDEALVYRAPCMQRTNIHNESPNACPSSGRCTKSISYKRIA